MATFSQRLRYIRKRHNLTQKEMGEKIGVSGPTITRWEQGQFEPSTETIKQIAEMFDVSVEFLVGSSDDESAKKNTLPYPLPFDLRRIKRQLEEGNEITVNGKPLPQEDQKLFREVVLPIVDRLIREHNL